MSNFLLGLLGSFHSHSQAAQCTQWLLVPQCRCQQSVSAQHGYVSAALHLTHGTAVPQWQQQRRCLLIGARLMMAAKVLLLLFGAARQPHVAHSGSDGERHTLDGLHHGSSSCFTRRRPFCAASSAAAAAAAGWMDGWLNHAPVYSPI